MVCLCLVFLCFSRVPYFDSCDRFNLSAAVPQILPQPFHALAPDLDGTRPPSGQGQTQNEGCATPCRGGLKSVPVRHANASCVPTPLSALSIVGAQYIVPNAHTRFFSSPAVDLCSGRRRGFQSLCGNFRPCQGTAPAVPQMPQNESGFTGRRKKAKLSF